MNYKKHVTKFNSKLGKCGATGKVIFRTEGAAKKRIKEILTGETNRCNNYLRAFHCFRCSYWHLTSSPERQGGGYHHDQTRPIHTRNTGIETNSLSLVPNA